MGRDEAPADHRRIKLRTARSAGGSRPAIAGSCCDATDVGDERHHDVVGGPCGRAPIPGRFRDGSPKAWGCRVFWLSLIVATAMSEDAPSKPSPRRMRSTGRGRNPSADLTNEGSLTAPNEPTTAPLCGRAPRRWYSTASLSQTNDHPLRTRAIMSAMSTFGRRHPVHRRALRQVAHRQPDDHVVSRDAVRQYISRFFRGDQ